MTRSGVRGGLGVACLMAASLGLLALSPGAAGAATTARADASGAERVAIPLAPGLSASEHAALQHSGAYGGRPVRLLILGDSIALTLGMGLAVRSQPHYGVTISDHGSPGLRPRPAAAGLHRGSAGPATQGCALWRGLWPLMAAEERPQVVALGLGRWEVADHLLNGQWVHIGEPAWDRHLSRRNSSRLLRIFHGIGARVVLFTMPYVDPSDRQPDGMPWSENDAGPRAGLQRIGAPGGAAPTRTRSA